MGILVSFSKSTPKKLSYWIWELGEIKSIRVKDSSRVPTAKYKINVANVSPPTEQWSQNWSQNQNMSPEPTV
jgi:hypothetical protein